MDSLLGSTVFEFNNFKASYLIVEAWAFHADFVVIDLISGDDVALDSNCTGSVDIVTGYHANSYTCLLNALYSTGYFFAHGILDTDNRD